MTLPAAPALVAPALVALALLGLAGCDAYDANRASGAGAMDIPASTDLPGTPGFTMARQACGQALAGPNGLMRVEFERDALDGALIMMHVRRDPTAEASQRWRCYFNYQTRSMRVIPA